MKNPTNIMLMCYELNKNSHRGIYQFSRSLIEAFNSNDINLGLFTQAYSNKSELKFLEQIHKSLQDPKSYFFKDNFSLKIVYSYLCSYLNLNKFEKILDNTEFNYFNFYINKPSFYYNTNIDLLFNGLLFNKDIKVSFMNTDDIIFTTAPLNINSSKHKVIQTVHDFIPFDTENVYKKYFKKKISSTVYANKILCVSEYTRYQYLNYFPQMETRTEVVYQPLPANVEAIQLSSLPEIQTEVLRKYGLKSKQYMYYVGAIEQRKNIHSLIKAYGLATNHDKSLPLVISGSVDQKYIQTYRLTEYFQNYQDYHSNQSNIMKTDFVSDIEKLVLLRNCRAFVFPTLSEGFGIPVIEAQTLGVPVLTSNNTSLPEVTDGSAFLLDDPLDIDEIKFAIDKLWSDDLLIEELSQKGLSNSQRFTKQKFAENLRLFLKDV